MIDPVDVLCWLSAGGALLGGGAYIYGYILKPRGDRRWHTASLLFSGFGLANLPLILRNGANGPNAFNAAVLVTFLLLGMSCQVVVAFRQRRGDRRAVDRAADAQPSAEAPAVAVAAPAPVRAPVRARAA